MNVLHMERAPRAGIGAVQPVVAHEKIFLFTQGHEKIVFPGSAVIGIGFTEKFMVDVYLISIYADGLSRESDDPLHDDERFTGIFHRDSLVGDLSADDVSTPDFLELRVDVENP